MNQNYNQEQNNLMPDAPRQPKVSLGESLFSWALTLIRAMVVATPFGTRLPQSFSMVTFGIAFLAYVIIERLVRECCANQRVRRICSANDAASNLYFVSLAIIYCFALGYDLAGTAEQRTSYLCIDIILLALSVIWFIASLVEWYMKYTELLDKLETLESQNQLNDI